MMKIFLSLITAAVVLGAPQVPQSPEAIANEDVMRAFAPSNWTRKYSEIGPVMVEKRSAIGIDEKKMRIIDTFEENVAGFLSQFKKKKNS